MQGTKLLLCWIKWESWCDHRRIGKGKEGRTAAVTLHESCSSLYSCLCAVVLVQHGLSSVNSKTKTQSKGDFFPLKHNPS